MKLNELSLTEAKQGLKEKRFSSVELTQACLDRIDSVDHKLNAFVTVTKERALFLAKHADEHIIDGDDKPLLGIPVSIKDNFCTRDITTTASSSVLSSFIPAYNATIVDTVEKAGGISVGKTNMDAWAHGSSTETSDFGATKNPWNLAHLPGGSSGGAAASIAADEALLGIGSETAGSIRQPAAWCGVVGLKPTYGRVSRFGVIAMASSLDSPGPITKTVEDAALMLEILAGKDPKDASTSPVEVKHYSKLMKEKKIFTIGIPDDYFTTVDAEIGNAVMNAITVLEKKGHIIKKINLFDPKYAIDVYTILQRSEVSSNLARYDGIRYGNDRSMFGDEAKRRVMLGTYALSAGYYDAYYRKAQKVRTVIVQDFANAFESVDLIISPTTPTTAMKLGASENQSMFGELADMLVEPSSIAGLPGINMPVGFSAEKLPMGMQIIGKQFDEEAILNLAYQYEQETNWRKEKPTI